MSDLTERLRRSASSWWAEDGLLTEAADEIERLRKALTKIAQDGVVSEGEKDWDVCTLGCWWTAKQALKGEDWYLDE